MARNLDASQNKDGHFTYGPADWSKDDFIWTNNGIWFDLLKIVPMKLRL